MRRRAVPKISATDGIATSFVLILAGPILVSHT
jgi:hypothetical protein